MNGFKTKQGKPLPILYNYIKSSASYRVRIAMNLKEISHSVKNIDLSKGEHLLKDYSDIVPLKRVPVYMEESNSFNLAQSIAIIAYLDEIYPEPSVFPFEDKKINAQIHAFAMTISCDIHPINNLSVLNYLRNNLRIDEQKVQEWYKHWITNGFYELERLLSIFSGMYSFANKVSLADICLIPQVFNCIRFKVPLNDFPNIKKVYENCLSLNAFIASSP